MPDFKPISRDAIPAALEKVERYRLLNEPALAESICHDVLAVDPHNQQALVMLLLALTDQFFDGAAGCVRQHRATRDAPTVSKISALLCAGCEKCRWNRNF